MERRRFLKSLLAAALAPKALLGFGKATPVYENCVITSRPQTVAELGLFAVDHSAAALRSLPINGPGCLNATNLKLASEMAKKLGRSFRVTAEKIAADCYTSR